MKTAEIINDTEVPCELLASNIVKIAEALEKIANGPLTMRALSILLKDATGVSLSSIQQILLAGPKLRALHIRKKP